MQTGRTPTHQNVSIASLGARVVAFLSDSVLLGIYLFMACAALLSLDVAEVWVWIMLVAMPTFVFGLFFELLMNGQTPGKRMMNLTVVKTNGATPVAGDYIVRWACGLIDFFFLFGLIPVIVIVSGGRGQRLGDIVAGTCVVKLPSPNGQAPAPVAKCPLTFPGVIQLDSYYTELIVRAQRAYHHHDNFKPMWILAENLKSHLHLETDMPPAQFLEAVLKDYNYLKKR